MYKLVNGDYVLCKRAAKYFFRRYVELGGRAYLRNERTFDIDSVNFAHIVGVLTSLKGNEEEARL